MGAGLRVQGTLAGLASTHQGLDSCSDHGSVVPCSDLSPTAHLMCLSGPHPPVWAFTTWYQSVCRHHLSLWMSPTGFSKMQSLLKTSPWLPIKPTHLTLTSGPPRADPTCLSGLFGCSPTAHCPGKPPSTSSPSLLVPAAVSLLQVEGATSASTHAQVLSRGAKGVQGFCPHARGLAYRESLSPA